MKKKIALFLLAIVILAAIVSLLFPPRLWVRNTTPAGTNIICFGDSLTYGTGASAGMDYPSQLSNLLGVPVINAGVPGDTTEEALKRLKKDVLSESPRMVLVILGVNDLAEGVPLEDIFEDLQKIVERIQDKGALVVVGGIDIPGTGKGLAGMYKKLCEKTGALLIPNIYEGILGRDDLMSDQFHPNDKGYQIIAERFYAAIKGYL